MISTRGRYALRVFIDLAEHNENEYIPMKKIAQRQEISLKYLERIMPVLVKEKLVDTLPGKGGGYKLNRKPEEYIVGEILQKTEGDLAPVACLGCDAKECTRLEICKTYPMWKEYYEMTLDYFNSITIADLLKNA